MNESTDIRIANMEDSIALPRSNGELVFEAPWECRAFGMAVALNEDKQYEWSEFQGRLAEEIAEAERTGASSTYYERWLASLERLLLEKGMVTPEELESRTAGYASGQRNDDWHDH